VDSTASFKGHFDTTSPTTNERPGTDSAEEVHKIDEAKSRLEVLWQRRQAVLAREDGDLNGAINNLQRAIDEHLGGRDYSKARLSQPVMTSNPEELFSAIKTNYFLFDTFAHSKAALLQRWYLKKHRAKSNNITLISKLFRGFRCRKAYLKRKEMRRQCAVKIQRRFRTHLIRMHALATMIKRWFQLRMIVKEYKKKLHLYRSARQIQRIFRGWRGRKAAALKLRQFQLVNSIQRTARAYVFRRNRAWVIALFHQKFWRAARTIQTLVRQQQAVERSQMKLLLEVSRENLRARKERIVVEEALRMQKIRHQFYLRSGPGRLHLHYVRRRLHVQGLSVQAAVEGLEQLEVDTQRLVAVLEEYDEDGTGNIPTKRLKRVLGRVLVPLTATQLLYLAQKLDPEVTGRITFNDLIGWYQSEEADDFVEPSGALASLAIMKLQVRSQAKQLLVRRKERAARKMMLAEHASWLAKDTAATFRQTHAPKFQCCQCRRAFVLFTDYFEHFIDVPVEVNAKTGVSTGGEGLCGVTRQRALFYPRYWVQEDWRAQRQLEGEIVRANDEHPYVAQQTRLQSYADQVYWTDHGERDATKLLVAKAADMYAASYVGMKKAALKKQTAQAVKELFMRTESSMVSDVVADTVMQALYLPVNKVWITDQRCTQSEMFKWLSKYLVEYEESDHSSFSDNTSSTKMSDFFKKEDERKAKHHQTFSLSALRPPTVSDSGIFRRRAKDMGTMHVRYLRALQVETQAALFALLEYRTRKPRR
jgi:hypothetical protein